MSPPRLTSTPQPLAAAAAAAARSAAQALAVAPRSSRTPAGMRIERALAIELHRPPAGSHPRGDRRVALGLADGARSSSCQSRSYPASSSARRPSGRHRRRSARRRAGPPRALRSAAGLTCTGRPARAFTRESSESARKRLHARSIASSSRFDRRARGVERPADRSTAARRWCRAPPTWRSRARRRPASRASSQDPPETTGAEDSGAGADSCAGADSWRARFRAEFRRGVRGAVSCAGADSWLGADSGRLAARAADSGAASVRGLRRLGGRLQRARGRRGGRREESLARAAELFTLVVAAVRSSCPETPVPPPP